MMNDGVSEQEALMNQPQQPTDPIKLKKWKLFNYVIWLFAFLGPTIILVDWNCVLLYRGKSYGTSSVSAVIAYGKADSTEIFILTIICAVIAFSMMAIDILARNIQIHVHFVNDPDSYSLCWRYVNLFTLILSFIGFFGFIFMMIYDTHTSPFVHIIYAGIAIGGLGLYQIFQGILTLKHRYITYKKEKNCAKSLYFIDGIYFVFWGINGILWTVVYVVTYQSTGTNITGSGPGIEHDYYKYQWASIWFLFSFVYMFMLTLYYDSTDDELQLFMKDSGYYLLKGFCNLNYVKAYKDKDVADQTSNDNL